MASVNSRVLPGFGLSLGTTLLYLSLNNKEEALHWLEQSFEERDGANISWIKVDHLLDPLHGDPRFQDLINRMPSPH